MNVMDCIREYVEQTELRVPILTNDIYEYVRLRFPNIQKNVLNEYIVRYGKINPNFVRHKKGVYYRTENTPFGKAGIKYPELIKRAYLQDGSEIIGYETGPSFMNKIGLTTQMPHYTYLATERIKKSHIDKKSGICLVKPVVNVTNENYRYLQFLDMLENRMNVAIEAENYQELLRDHITRFDLSFEGLIGYARFYNNQNVFLRLSELATGVNV